MSDADIRRIDELSTSAALRLLGTVSFGRVAFTLHALPAIRPATHVLDEGDVIIRSHSGSELNSAVGQIVAYEAGVISPEDHLGWSVSVTGKAELVSGSAAERCELLLRPWSGLRPGALIRIPPEFVSGYALRNGTP
ncbi:pyridoxamine 5'-phosphate oxidase family protein [Prauserella flavalba]|uniref:Pyridoxamine 5'-phosphate oxidase n=1 Tax=Prauserella flavalba TaxID=1477506 RepID=A0A318LQE5_9PSEU|nr:pyridoxamine 5'-phosphate oxidase family protein [Prauserella flavalba]PXY30535.1 hypothetical protein BA062_18420 [Prauserella flavalba]